MKSYHYRIFLNLKSLGSLKIFNEWYANQSIERALLRSVPYTSHLTTNGKPSSGDYTYRWNPRNL